MKNEVKMCPSCPNINLENMSKVIKELDSTANIKEICVGMCGICQKKAFIVLNGIPIIKDTEEELIKEVKSRIK